jgi:hypothetical protein
LNELKARLVAVEDSLTAMRPQQVAARTELAGE